MGTGELIRVQVQQTAREPWVAFDEVNRTASAPLWRRSFEYGESEFRGIETPREEAFDERADQYDIPVSVARQEPTVGGARSTARSETVESAREEEVFGPPDVSLSTEEAFPPVSIVCIIYKVSPEGRKDNHGDRREKLRRLRRVQTRVHI